MDAFGIIFDDGEQNLKVGVLPDRYRAYRETILKFRYWLRETDHQPVAETFKRHLGWKQSHFVLIVRIPSEISAIFLPTDLNPSFRNKQLECGSVTFHAVMDQPRSPCILDMRVISYHPPLHIVRMRRTVSVRCRWFADFRRGNPPWLPCWSGYRRWFRWSRLPCFSCLLRPSS